MNTLIRSLAVAFLFVLAPSARPATLVSTNTSWRYLKGLSEASSPPNAWRQLTFPDTSWQIGQSPLGYAEPLAMTVLGDMPSRYSCLFLRKAFSSSTIPPGSLLQLDVVADDGLIAWINGVEVLRQNVPGEPGEELPAQSLALAPTQEPPAYHPHTLTVPANIVIPGPNLLAVQAFNVGRNDDDFLIGVGLRTITVMPPTITTQPQSQTVPRGANATFTVTASGSPPPAWQWRFNEQEIANATNATLTVVNVGPANTGRYSVLVSNSGGTVTSQVANLRTTVPEYFFTSNFLPPLNSDYVSVEDFHAAYAMGAVLKGASHSFFTANLPPPSGPGQTQHHEFGSQARFQISMDEGNTYTPVTASANVGVRLTDNGSNGPVQSLSTEMTQFDISGGSLPPGVRVRENPVCPSFGETTVRPVAGGFMISSYFDIWTELSLDDGLSWSPALAPIHVEMRRKAPEVFFGESQLPPLDSEYVSPEEYHAAYANGIVLQDASHSFFTQRFAPPGLGAQQFHNFSSQVRVQVSMNGGAAFTAVTAPAAVSVHVAHTVDFGSNQVFQTEMRQLDISGGELPPGVALRVNPNCPSIGETTIRPVPGGFRIASFFDLWTQFSTDNGLTWLSAPNPIRVELNHRPPENYFVSSELPPAAGEYVSPEDYHAAYANGIVLRDVSHRFFTQSAPPPPGGGTQVHQFDSEVSFKISTDGGVTFSNMTANAAVGVRVRHVNGTGGNDLYRTEMFQLDVSGGSLPPGVRLRESPALASEGRTRISATPGGQIIASQFDLSTELSLDDGATWTPGSDPVRMELRSLAREGFFSAGTLPPGGGRYVGTADFRLGYANGVVIEDVSSFGFTQSFPPPPLGGTRLESFSSPLTFRLSTDGGASFMSVSAVANAVVSVTHTRDAGLTQIYQVEWRHLEISGGNLPPGLMVRAATNIPCCQFTTLRPTAGGYLIGSSLDLRADVSLDGGQTWTASSDTGHLELISIPRLNIGREGTGVVVSWHESAGDYRLQFATNLISPDWVDVTASPSHSGNQLVYTFPPVSTVGFCRLTTWICGVFILPDPLCLCKDKTATATATGIPAGGTYSWKSGDESIAKIEGPSNQRTVTVKGLKAGTTKLTVTYKVNGRECTDSVPVNVICVDLALKNTGTIVASPENEDYDTEKAAAGGTDALGPVPMGDGRQDFPGEAYTSPLMVVGPVTPKPTPDCAMFRWKRLITRRSWNIRLSDDGTKWVVTQRSSRGTAAADDDTGDDAFNDPTPSADQNKIYIYDNSALVPGNDRLDKVGDFIREEKQFTYIVEVKINGVWSECAKLNVGQVIVTKRKAVTGTTKDDWEGVENSTGVRELDAKTGTEEVRGGVGGDKPIEVDAHAND